MTKYNLYVGLNDKETKQQKISMVEAYKIATNIMLHYTEGATIYETQGIYKHKNGKIIIETTLKIELLFIELETVQEIAKDLKKTFNQEEVILEMQDYNSVLI